MSAPTLTVQQKIHSLKNKSAKSKQNSNAKAVLYSPYLATWPVVDKKVLKEILAKLDSVFSETEVPLAVLQMKPELSRKRETKPQTKTKEAKLAAKKDRCLLVSERQHMLSEARKELSSPEGINLRKQLVKGIQEVTKQLERDSLRLVLVDRGSETMIHHHLVALSASRKCPAAAVRGLADTMRPHLRVGSLVAIGFKKRADGDSDKFDSMIDFVSKRLPPVEYGFHSNTDTGVEEGVEEDGICSRESSKSSQPEDCSNDSANIKPSEGNDSKITDTMDTASLYVYKTVSNSGFGNDNFISFGQDEIEDVTVDAEPTDQCSVRGQKFPEQSHVQWQFSDVRSKKRKRKLDPNAAKRQNESRMQSAKVGRVKVNDARKKKKREKS